MSMNIKLNVLTNRFFQSGIYGLFGHPLLERAVLRPDKEKSHEHRKT